MTSHQEKSDSRSAPGEAGDAGDEAGSFLRGKSTDEAWKEKARRERDELAAREARESEARELPPASFLGLVEELSVRALFALGQIIDPASGDVYVDLPAAKYTIDLLGILEEKTRGNLSEAERSYVADVVQKLRLAFVTVSRDPDGPRRAAEAARAEIERHARGAKRGEAPPEPRIIV